MTIQTERLEALLARVQENRQQPRAMAAAAAGLSAAQQHQAPPPERRVEARPPEPRAKPAATPLEIAFEAASVNNASVNNASARAPIAGATHHAPVQVAGSAHQAPAQATGAARGLPAQAASAAQAPRDGMLLVDPAPMQPSRPIAQVVSKHPPSTASTFGELLRRSLSLRPR